MTREEFKNTPPIYEWCLFEGVKRKIIYVNTQELCGLDMGDNIVFWVRCENIELIYQ